MVEKTDYEEIFTTEICKCIFNSCLVKCGNMVECHNITGLKIKAIKLICDEKQTFIKMKSPMDGHVWYRWRRGAKKKYIEKINESIEDEALYWTHLAYIKFVRKIGTDLSVPIVVGKSNSSASFDLVYTMKEDINGKENSKSWLKENNEWEWDIENLVVFIPCVILSDEKEIPENLKFLLCRKISYEVESYLFKRLKAGGSGVGHPRIFMS